jgi:hypothetical protein
VEPNVAVEAVEFSCILPNTVVPHSRSFVYYIVWYLVCTHDRSVGILTGLRAGRSRTRDFSNSPEPCQPSLGSMHLVRNWVPPVFTQQDGGQCFKQTTLTSMSSPLYGFVA